MKKVDATVARETVYIAVWVCIFSVLMEAVFLIAGQWDITVLLGNLLGGFFAVLNFFLMGLTVQAALGKEEKQAADLVRLSQTLRTLMLFFAAMVGVLVPVFHLVAALIPLLFPRIAIMLRPMFYRREETSSGSESEGGKQ